MRKSKNQVGNNARSRTIFVPVLLSLLALAVLSGVFAYVRFHTAVAVQASPSGDPAGAELTAQENPTEVIADERTPLASSVVGGTASANASSAHVGVAIAADRFTVDAAPLQASAPQQSSPSSGASGTGDSQDQPDASGSTDPSDSDEPPVSEDAGDAESSGEQEEADDSSTSAERLLARAAALIEQYNACSTAEEKRVLLDASNYSLGNDAIRAKLLSDLGGSWEQLEQEVVDATEYQQGKTLYVQVFISGVSSDYVAVAYTTANSDLSGNQWATNLVYDDDTDTWMEYTQKHPYNDSRVGYYMTPLYNTDGSWDAMKDMMESSDVWQEVVVPDETTDGSAGAPESSVAPEPETSESPEAPDAAGAGDAGEAGDAGDTGDPGDAGETGDVSED